jgi:hypothetical protein
MTDYACPNGHVFPGALTVPCDECGAAVVCEPIAAPNYPIHYPTASG